MLGRSALLAATNSENYGNWLGNYSDVSLLLRNGTQGFVNPPIDESPTPKTLSIIGNVSVSTSVFKHGGSSLAFDGSGDGIGLGIGNSAYAFGSGDFTVEAWVYRLSAATGTIFAGQSDLASAAGSSCIFYVSSGSSSDLYVGGGAYSVVSPNPGISQWAHVAWVRKGGTFISFLNGTVVGTNTTLGTASVNIGSTTFQACIGQWATGSNAFNGFIDDFRITKGIARYELGTGANANQMVFAGTNNLAYSVLNSTQLPANITDDLSYNSVSLLLRNGTPGLIPFDESPTPKTITAVGNAGISTTVFKYGTGALTFDGSGDYFTISNLATDLLNNNFTIEAWVRINTASSNQTFLNSSPHSTLAISLNRGGSGQTSLFIGNGSSWLLQDFRSSGTISNNVWTHLAVVRNNNSIAIYHDGVSQGSNTAAMPSGLTGQATIGGNFPSGAEWFNGQIDDIRITRNFARYTSNFTPPPAQLPNF